MEIIQELLEEFQTESKKTKDLLSRVPFDQFGYKPHERSMALGQLAVHIVEMAGWTRITLNESELDFAKSPYTPSTVNSTDDLLQLHQQFCSDAIEVFKTTSEDVLHEDWTLRSGEHIIFTMSKYKCLRLMVFNHIVHHRAQLGVYLRLLNIPIPGMFGPSADEM